MFGKRKSLSLVPGITFRPGMFPGAPGMPGIQVSATARRTLPQRARPSDRATERPSDRASDEPMDEIDG